MTHIMHRLQRVTQEIIAAFEAYDGASYGLNYTTMDLDSVVFPRVASYLY